MPPEPSAEEQQSVAASLHADDAIRSAEQDLLDRTPLARMIANQLVAVPAQNGFVVGLTGPWGTGKTSILNLVEEYLGSRKDVRVVRFNPWLFSGTEQLVSQLFRELGRRLKVGDERWKQIGELFEFYGALLTPLQYVAVVGGPWGIALGVIAKVGQAIGMRAKPKSLEDQRNALLKALDKAPQRLVIVLDDIDRLQDNEIQEIMRLVRLVGDFPNCVYLLSFDRRRVESCLGAIGGDGREYLEKITQLTYEVPPVRREDIWRLVGDGLQKVTERVQHGPFEPELWQNIYRLGVFPLIRTLRDVRRYLNGSAVTLEMVGAEVAVADVLGLEAIRVLRPDIFELLSEAVEALTTLRGTSGRLEEQHRTQLNAMLEVAKADRSAVNELVIRLFPATQQYLRNTFFSPESQQQWGIKRRVAHQRNLRYYLERGYPDGVHSNRYMEELLAQLPDRARLQARLTDLSPTALEALLERLEEFETEYPREAVEPATIALLNILPRLSRESKGMFDFGSAMKLQRVLYRLLKSIEDEPQRRAIIERVLPQLQTLSAKRSLVMMAGHDENAGHQFIPRDVATRLAGEVAHEILVAEDRVLAEERDLPWLLSFLMREGTEADCAALRQRLEESGLLFEATLAAVMRERYSQALGDVAVHRWESLDWGFLKELMDGEEALIARVRRAAASPRAGRSEREVRALELASQFASGWRPEEERRVPGQA